MKHYLTVGGVPWCVLMFTEAYLERRDQSGINWCGHVSLEGAQDAKLKLEAAGVTGVVIHDGNCPTYEAAYEYDEEPQIEEGKIYDD